MKINNLPSFAVAAVILVAGVFAFAVIGIYEFVDEHLLGSKYDHTEHYRSY